MRGSFHRSPGPCTDHRGWRRPQSILLIAGYTQAVTARETVGTGDRRESVSLEFQTETSSRSCFDALADGNLDLAWVTIGSPVRGIEQRPVVDLTWVLAVRADDPLARRTRIDVAGLPGRQVPGDDGPLRLLPISDLPPLPVAWAVRRWDALSPLARAQPPRTGLRRHRRRQLQ